MRKNNLNKWQPINKENVNEILFTNMNFDGTTNVSGNIDGSNDIFNTLVMTNTGKLNLYYNTNELSVYSLVYIGTINFLNPTNSTNVNIRNNSVTGNGTLDFRNGFALGDINYVENTVNVNDTFLSLLDGNKNRVNISKLNSNNAGLYLDFGDKFVLQNNSDVSFNS